MIHLRNSIITILLLVTLPGISQIVKPDFNLVRGAGTYTFNHVISIAQDKYGYMWFNDQNNGALVRYDGYHIKAFHHDPADTNSLSQNVFECIAADKSGNIWIGVDSGADKFDFTSNKFIHYRYPKGEDGSGSDALLIDHNGIVWMGGHNGLSSLNPATGKFTFFVHKDNDPSSLSYNYVRSLYEDKEGVLWVGTGLAFDTRTKEGGLNRFNKETGTFTRYVHDPKDPHSLMSNKIRALFEDSKGNFWVGTDGDGLHIMNREKGNFERLAYDSLHPEKLSRPPVDKDDAVDHITFITEDVLGKIWIGTYKKGIVVYDPATKKMDHFDGTDRNRHGGYTDNSTWKIYTSKEGVLWISDDHNDLFRVDPLQTGFTEVKMETVVGNFAEDSSGNIWMNPENKGLLMMNTKTNEKKYFLHNPSDQFSISSNQVSYIEKRGDGQFWIATWNKGLNLFNPVTKRFTRFFYNSSNDESKDTIVAKLLETKNEIYFGLSIGLGVQNKNTGVISWFINNPADSNSLSSGIVFPHVVNKDGSIWMTIWHQEGSELGLFNPKTKKYKHYLKDLHIIWDIFKSSEGKIWVGTSNGLYYFNDSSDSFLHIDFEGLEFSKTKVKSMTEDANKNLWGVCLLGIFRFNPYKHEVNIYGDKFGTFDVGALPYESTYRTANGEILFANPHGYYKCSPSHVFNSMPPQIVITDFKINEHSIEPGKDDLLKEPLQDIQEITLDHNQNIFSIDFAAIHFSDPENNIHQYMMEGYENKWRNATAEKTAYYFNLPTGHYIFKIKVSSSYGVKAEKSIKIIVLPPWWQTWWAYALYLLLLAFIVWIFIRWRTKTLQKEKHVLESKVMLRTKELKNEKEIVEATLAELKSAQNQLIQAEKMASLGELTAGIAHEIQNPLNFINNFSDVNTDLLKEMKDEIGKGNYDEASAIANDIITNEEKINHHGKRADAIVKGMLQHSRTNTGIKELTNINALADEYLRLSYHGLRAKDKDFNARMKTDFDQSIGKINMVPQDIGRVLLNLYNNAFYAVNEKKKLADAGFDPVVSVSTKKSGNQIFIRIGDNGNGILPKVVDKIFQPFFTTKPSGQGTGLGLSLAYDIIKAHGGEIKVETKEREGAEFIIELPIQQ